MSEGYQADPAALRTHAAGFAGYADRTGAIHQQLRQTLESAGTCWGADEAGQNFAAGYLPGAQGTLDALAGLPDKLSDVGNRFTSTAGGYEQAEQDNAQALRGAAGDPGGSGAPGAAGGGEG